MVAAFVSSACTYRLRPAAAGFGRCLSGLVAAALALALLAGCTVNPATGQSSFTGFMSPADEKRVGAEEHPKILKQFGGAYAEGTMDDYVRRVGQRLAAVAAVEGPSFTFTVLSDDKVNAFALPGGYVYVTRGLLALAGNEAEMAGVLAHEIGHVAARHTAQRYSQAMATNLGLTILGVVGSIAGAPPGLGDVLSFGAQAYLQSFSREQELEADMLAVRYLRRAGYDANAMVSLFDKMQAFDRLEAAELGVPSAAERYNIMSTHPRTTDRIGQAMRLAGPEAAGRQGRDEFLAQIDGLMFGDDPRQGVRRGRVFSHPGIGVQFTMPPGYVLINAPTYVAAKGPEDSLVIFDMESPRGAREAGDMVGYLLNRWGREVGLGNAERIEVNGMQGATAAGRIGTRKGTMDIRLVAVRDNASRIFRFRFVTPPRLTAAQREEFQRTTYSLRLLTPAEAVAIRPLRVRVLTVVAGDTADKLAGRMPFERLRRERFDALNGFTGETALTPGQRVKIIAE